MKTVALDGVLLCARYSFAPNLYRYCGPDTNGEFGEYVAAETADLGLTEHLSRFETLYPYFKVIAQANGIADPFDTRVVEAYWIGNQLLERVSEQETYEALTVYQKLPKRIPKNDMKWLLPKIDEKARLHHSFHVFNVFMRTGHHTVPHTVETMDQCRIAWGQIRCPKHQKICAKKVLIKSQKLQLKDGKLTLVPAEREVVIEQEALGKRLQTGDWVSVHWGFVCDKLTTRQVKVLEAYTQHHLRLANETI